MSKPPSTSPPSATPSTASPLPGSTASPSPGSTAPAAADEPGLVGAASPMQRHTLLDDVQAFVTGTLFMALGVALFKHAGLLSGGMAGLAFLFHYGGGLPFGPVFFALNLPFYWLAWRRMGRAFTFKTFAAIAMVSVLIEWTPRWIGFSTLAPWYAAVIGGLVMGAGMLVLFRHRASLGGFGILALVLQERRGWRAGKVQLLIDSAILAAALAFVPWQRVALSIVGAAAMNLILAINFKPGRYMAA